MKLLYQIYTILIAWPLFAVDTIITGTLVVIFSLLGDRTYTAYYLPKMWAKIACWLFLIKVNVVGKENISDKQSYVFLANHQGYFDIFLVYGYIGHNFKWMMKEYIKKMPFVGVACMASGQIFVGDSISAIGKAVGKARKTLQNGMSMVIFPEGTRSHDGKMQPFKRGAFMLANEIGLPIVPITIDGSFDIFSRHSAMVSRHPLTMTIHEPITAEQREGKNTKQLMQEVFDVINDGLPEKHRTIANS